MTAPKITSLFGDDFDVQPTPNFKKFPVTCYQGSKRKLLPFLYGNIPHPHNGAKALDLFSGSGSVSLLLREMGYAVHANDFMMYNAGVAELFISCDNEFLNDRNHEKHLYHAIHTVPKDKRRLVEENYSGIYFTDEENEQLDNFMHNVREFSHQEQLLYRYCVGESLTKKRPLSLFHRANLYHRFADVKRNNGNAVTWERSIYDSSVFSLTNIREMKFTQAVLPHAATSLSADDLSQFSDDYDLVYLDPPYCNHTGKSIDYSDFYNFLAGLWDYDLFGNGLEKYKHKPLVRKPSAWSNHEAAEQWLRDAVKHFRKAIIALSYRDDGLPDVETIESILSEGGRNVKTVYNGGYNYRMSKNKTSQEILVLSVPEGDSL